MRFENGIYVPNLEHFGYYCPDCWTFWGATFAEVQKNRKQHNQKKYDDAISTWHSYQSFERSHHVGLDESARPLLGWPRLGQYISQDHKEYQQ